MAKELIGLIDTKGKTPEQIGKEATELISGGGTRYVKDEDSTFKIEIDTKKKTIKDISLFKDGQWASLDTSNPTEKDIFWHAFFLGTPTENPELAEDKGV